MDRASGRGRAQGEDSAESDLQEQERLFLARYDRTAFPAFAVTVDAVLATIHQGRLCVLLVERDDYPQRGYWALPGGFVGLDEDLPDAARRKLAQETGLGALPAGVHLEQLGTYGRPGRDPRMRVVSVAYLALAPDVAPPALAPATAPSRARFWPVGDLAGEDAPPLAFDHADIVRDAVERARAKLEYTTVALAFVGEPFTLADLRRVYEAVWGAALDGSNFRKRALDNEGFVVPLGSEAPRAKGGSGGRPAELYRRGTATRLERTITRPRGSGELRDSL